MDYSAEHILIKITRAGSTGFASVNSEMKPEFDNLLELEGSFFVYLLHPFKGGTFFTIAYDPDQDKWQPVDAADWIEQDIIEEIITKIRHQKHF